MTGPLRAIREVHPVDADIVERTDATLDKNAAASDREQQVLIVVYPSDDDVRSGNARTEQERIRRARRSVGYRIIAAADVEPVGVISFSSPQNIIAETSGKGVISGHAFKCVASI